MSSVPILFLTFKRPNTTKQVLDSIRLYKPERIYIASDGHRPNQLGEEEKVEATRKLVIDQINWPCDIKILFQNKNLGCRVGVSTAIDWFFEHESEGIILEDDCVPDVSFYSYVDDLLTSYRNDQRVMSISGHNFNFDSYINVNLTNKYIFSRYHHCWGWATWKRAWRHNDREMINWPLLRDSNWLLSIGDGNLFFKDYWTYIFERAYQNKIDSWAYRWLFSCWSQSGLSILPISSLVQNIGFEEDATHTLRKLSQPTNYEVEDFRKFKDTPLSQGGTHITRNVDLDKVIDKHWFNIGLMSSIKRKLINY
jgi:hypothetical protein